MSYVCPMCGCIHFISIVLHWLEHSVLGKRTLVFLPCHFLIGGCQTLISSGYNAFTIASGKKEKEKYYMYIYIYKDKEEEKKKNIEIEIEKKGTQ